MPAIKASNIPAELEDKFKSCKEKVMAEGKSEDEAYAICYTSVVEGKEEDSDKARKPRTRLLMKGPQHLDGKKCFASKCDYCDMAYPMTYPTSLTGLAEAREAQAQASAIQSLTYDFQDVTSGILQSPEITDKAQAIAQEAGVFQTLLADLAAGLKSLGAKWGARHSKADDALVQGMHDMSVQLGALCSGKAKSAFGVCKGLDGNYYGLGVFTNCYEDLEQETLKDTAHKEFCSYLDANPDQAPELWDWHTPGTARKSRATWWDYTDNGFFWMLWPLTPAEAKALEGVTPCAMSHQFNGVKELRDWVFYRTFEASLLDLGFEANPYTSFDMVQKELLMAKGFSPEKRAWLMKIHGEERVKQLEADEDATRKALDLAGAVRKEQAAKDAEAITPVAETTAAEVIATPEELAKRLGLPAIVEGLAKLQQDVTALGGAVKALQVSKDNAEREEATAKERAQWFSPRAPISSIAQAAKSHGGELSPEDAAKAGVLEMEITAPGWENASKDIQRR